MVLVWGYGTYTFDKRLDTLEETIEHTAQEVKVRPKEAIERGGTQDRLRPYDEESTPPPPTWTPQPTPATWFFGMPIPPQFQKLDPVTGRSIATPYPLRR